MNKRSLLLLSLIVLVSSALSFAMLTRGHPWWDDFAAYLMQARAILNGDLGGFIAHNTFTIQNSSYPPGPVAYPWGYPLLLAPVVAVFGLHPLALKLVGVAFYALFLVIFYALARTRLTERDSLLLTGVLACNPALLQANDLILSDIPFLTLSTLAIWWIESSSRHGEEHQTGRDLMLGLILFCAACLRTNGLLLIVPLILSYLARHWPDWKTSLRRLLPPLLTYGLLSLIAGLLLPNGQDSYLSHFSMLTLPRLWDNLLYYLGLPSWAFTDLPAGPVFYPLLAVGLLVSLAAHARRDLAIHAYSLVTLGLFILWPERQGLRFIYPWLPFLFIFACDGLRLLVKRLPLPWQQSAARALSAFWVVLLLLSLGSSASRAYDNLHAQRAINGPFDEYSHDLYRFIRAETPAEAVIVFVRPRAMRLFTERDSFMTTRCADLPRGDYIALSKKVGDVGQIPPEEITACPGLNLQAVFSNRRFIVYHNYP